MKTIIYIDGYNLFYGCLKHSRDKWLDLYRLFVGVLNAQQPATELVKIKFFTADIKAKVASHGHEAMLAQQDYHRALMTLYPNQLEIQKGFYTLELADWTRRYLTDEELAAAQLPVMIPTQKKPIRKPAYW